MVSIIKEFIIEWEIRYWTIAYKIKVIKTWVGGQRLGESMKNKGQIGKDEGGEQKHLLKYESKR